MEILIKITRLQTNFSVIIEKIPKKFWENLSKFSQEILV